MAPDLTGGSFFFADKDARKHLLRAFPTADQDHSILMSETLDTILIGRVLLAALGSRGLTSNVTGEDVLAALRLVHTARINVDVIEARLKYLGGLKGVPESLIVEALRSPDDVD